MEKILFINFNKVLISSLKKSDAFMYLFLCEDVICVTVIDF